MAAFSILAWCRSPRCRRLGAAVIVAGLVASGCGQADDDAATTGTAATAPATAPTSTSSIGAAESARAGTEETTPGADGTAPAVTGTTGTTGSTGTTGTTGTDVPTAAGAGTDAADFPHPVAVSGRKVLDQYGHVYLMRTFSSWSMPQHLSDAEITTALEGVAANGFNAVTVWIGGGYHIGDDWHRYTNAAGERFWTGKPWQSALGPGWSSVDRIVAETARLGLTLNMSFAGAWGEDGAGPDWEAATDQQMYDAGVAIATRYRRVPHIVWHVMFDFSTSPSSTRGQRIDALFHGINDTEGVGTRPVRWAEPDGATTVWKQLIDVEPGFKYFNLTLNGWYNAPSGSSAEVAEHTYDEADMPIGDVEPTYDGAGHYKGDQGQQIRERSYATFLEGGMYINYGQEDWWPFGAKGLYTEGLRWQDVPKHVHTVQQSYVWKLIDEYCSDPTWAPTSSFVTKGEGKGDHKAAIGASKTAAIAYFPSKRDVVVDTTKVGTGNVRLRWYDPTAGTFTTIAASEQPNAARPVDFPDEHEDGTRDWVLVVDAVNASGS